MIGSLLVLVSTLVLATAVFPGQRPQVRLAAAALIALGGPILMIVIAARMGLANGTGLVVGSHALLWLFAGASKVRNGQGQSQSNTVAPVAFVCLLVSLLTALLGRDPNGVEFVDAWAHLTWSRSVADAMEVYAPGFPAFVSMLSPLDPLVGAFRGSAWVIHFAVAAQFMALGTTARGIGPAVLAALAYLLVPAAGLRFEPPGPELLSAVFLAGITWVLLLADVGMRTRWVLLAVLTMLVIVVHVSALQIAMFVAFGLAIALGVESSRLVERVWALLAIIAGIAGAAILSPAFWSLIVDPESVALVSQQAGEVRPIGVKTLVAGLGISICGLLLLGSFRAMSHFRASNRREIALLTGLLMAATALVAPIVLVRFGISVPLQLFTERLIMAAALPLALCAGILSARGSSQGSTAFFLLASGVILVAQLLRPAATWPMLGLAMACSGVAWLVLVTRGNRGTAVVGVLVAAAGLWVRLWIWTPEIPPAARWFLDEGGELPVVANWPVTNELDALLDQTILDGLAGQDSNQALHRSGYTSDLRDRLSWCGDGDEREEIARFLHASGHQRAYLVVDDRFELAWQVHASQQGAAGDSMTSQGTSGSHRVPCPLSGRERLALMRERFGSPGFARAVFSSPHVTIYLWEQSPGAIDPEKESES